MQNSMYSMKKMKKLYTHSHIYDCMDTNIFQKISEKYLIMVFSGNKMRRSRLSHFYVIVLIHCFAHECEVTLVINTTKNKFCFFCSYVSCCNSNENYPYIWKMDGQFSKHIYQSVFDNSKYSSGLYNASFMIHISYYYSII